MGFAVKTRNLYALEGLLHFNDAGEFTEMTASLTQIEDVDKATFKNVLDLPDTLKTVLLDGVAVGAGDAIQLTKLAPKVGI